ncbi:MAG TPA: hypothetical protein VJ872_18565 [Nocardioides sp.]|nr:hypothetical protein [Nocardioides sp.]
MKRPRPTRRWTVVAVVVALVVVALGVVGWVRARSGPESRLSAAMALAPRTAVRFSWTDWSAVRAKLGVSEAEATDHVGAFLSQAFDADLSSTSALDDSAPTLAAKLGVSPANLSWELYAQGTDGAVVVMGLPDDVTPAELRVTLGRVGYTDPGTDDGVWQVGSGGLSSIGNLTPELTNLTIDAGHHVLAASDSAAFLRDWRGNERGTGDDSAVASVATSLGDAVSAAAYDGGYACQALAMNQADPADAAEGARLIAEAGKINPLDAFAMGYSPDGSVQVRMLFENPEQARTNATTRATLAVGPAPGQGGSFTDRYRLVRTTADKDLVSMTLQPVPGSYVLSDLDAGPLLFASC